MMEIAMSVCHTSSDINHLYRSEKSLVETSPIELKHVNEKVQ